MLWRINRRTDYNQIKSKTPCCARTLVFHSTFSLTLSHSSQPTPSLSPTFQLLFLYFPPPCCLGLLKYYKLVEASGSAHDDSFVNEQDFFFLFNKRLEVQSSIISPWKWASTSPPVKTSAGRNDALVYEPDRWRKWFYYNYLNDLQALWYDCCCGILLSYTRGVISFKAHMERNGDGVHSNLFKIMWDLFFPEERCLLFLGEEGGLRVRSTEAWRDWSFLMRPSSI